MGSRNESDTGVAVVVGGRAGCGVTCGCVTSKFGATLRDFIFGHTVKAQVILFHNVQSPLVVCYSGILMGWVRSLTKHT